MTQIGGFIPPTRKRDVVGVHSMDYFNLAVPNLEEARNFYTKFGLDVLVGGNCSTGSAGGCGAVA